METAPETVPPRLSAPSPTGRDITLEDDRFLVLLSCRHWFQFRSWTRPDGVPVKCMRCNRPRPVVAVLTNWDVAEPT